MANTLVIDQGTHATRAILLDAQGSILQTERADISLHRLDHQRVEQDADEILHSVHHVLQRLAPEWLAHTDRCAIATQRSTMVAWDRQSGQPLHPALSWQDRRAAATLEQLSEQASAVRRITGLPLSPHYGAAKIRWLLEHVEAVARAGERLCIAPLASFLLHRLLSEAPCVLDHSNAHRTQLLDLRQLDWSQPLLDLFSIPADLLPRCQPVVHDYGQLAQLNLPVTAVCGDQTAALYAQGPWQPGSAFVNLGTGAFILCPVDDPVHHDRLLCSVGRSDHEQPPDYLLEATVNGAGAALSWAAERFPVNDLYTRLADWLTQDRVTHGLFINTLGGLGSPWWKDGGEPHFIHQQDLDPADRYVAIIESIVFMLVANLQLMQEKQMLERLYVSGGLSQLDGLCQRLADLSRLPVDRLADTEATARGASWLARRCPQQWPVAPPDRQFIPGPNPALRTRFAEFKEHIRKL